MPGRRRSSGRPPGGWLLRATPGLDRGRSNTALTPCRELGPEELGGAIERVEAFAREHGIRPGIQVSPLGLHDGLQRELDARGWGTRWPTLVMTGPLTGPAESPVRLATLTVDDHASADWLRAWARCEPGRDIAAHAAPCSRCSADGPRSCGSTGGPWRSPYRPMACWVCSASPSSPPAAGRGWARRSCAACCHGTDAGLAYLQVEERNLPARAMYERLGFSSGYRYCHRIAAR